MHLEIGSALFRARPIRSESADRPTQLGSQPEALGRPELLPTRSPRLSVGARHGGPVTCRKSTEIRRTHSPMIPPGPGGLGRRRGARPYELEDLHVTRSLEKPVVQEIPFEEDIPAGMGGGREKSIRVRPIADIQLWAISDWTASPWPHTGSGPPARPTLRRRRALLGRAGPRTPRLGDAERSCIRCRSAAASLRAPHATVT